MADRNRPSQTILSALEQGDGAVIASSTGAGKTYTEWRGCQRDASSRTPTRKFSSLRRTAVAENVPLKSERKTLPRDGDWRPRAGTLDKNVYGASYQRFLNNPIYNQTQWDLVIADESGEARNWHLDENQQGKLLKAVMDNAKKGVYVSATPFHSPSEYGYFDKLNLWPKGQFENWIKENFAHEKIGDKIVAKLDPASRRNAPAVD